MNHCCPKCKSTSLADKSNRLICRNCNSAYPVINKVPYFFRDPEKVLTSTFIAYQKSIANTSSINSSIQNSPRKDTIKSHYQTATTQQINLLEQLKANIKPFINLEDIINHEALRSTEALSYDMNFDYLRRDWSGEPSCENEISEIVAAVNRQLINCKLNTQNALFLGAGAGRYLKEFSLQFDTIDAIDYSFTLVHLFNELRHRSLDLCTFNLKNIKLNNQVTEHFKLPQVQIPDSVCYVGGDVNQLPYKEESFTHVISIYFTDVQPLKNWFDEVAKLIAPGGYFIHLGPLQYHFDDLSQMYTPEELVSFFESKGFSLNHNESFVSSHYGTNHSLALKYYENLVFTFQKGVKSHKLDSESVLKVKNGLKYQKVGAINNNTVQDEEKVLFHLPNNEWVTSSELILEILSRLDNSKNIGLIIEDINTEFNLEIPLNNEVFEQLEHLLKTEVVEIKY